MPRLPLYEACISSISHYYTRGVPGNPKSVMHVPHENTDQSGFANIPKTHVFLSGREALCSAGAPWAKFARRPGTWERSISGHVMQWRALVFSEVLSLRFEKVGKPFRSALEKLVTRLPILGMHHPQA